MIRCECEYCKREFYVLPSELKRGRKFCSLFCFHGFRIGMPTWSKGLTKETDERVKTNSENHRGIYPSEETRKKMSISGKGRKFSEEHKKRISHSLMGKNKGKHPKTEFKSGEKHPMYKKKMSKDVKEKLEENLYSKIRGKTYEELYGKKAKELKEKLSESHKGKKKSDLTRERMRIARLGEKNHFFGKHHTEETKKKIKRVLDDLKKKGLYIMPIKDTSIEIRLQDLLKELHLNFYTHYWTNIKHAYQCDIFIPKQIISWEQGFFEIPQNTIIEADGCYWHGCKECNKSRKKEFSQFQLEQIKEDNLRTKELEEKGYKVIRLWEHDIKKMELNEFKEKII